MHARLVEKTDGYRGKGLFQSGHSAKGFFLADSFARLLITKRSPPMVATE